MQKHKGEREKMNLKSNKAITMVVLIVTIIVMLILAGVTLTLVLGENGLIEKTKASVNKYEMASKNEEEQLQAIEDYMDNYDLTNGGQSKAIKYLGFPDYANRVALAPKEKFTADENMYLIIDTTGKVNGYISNRFSITIDGMTYNFEQGVLNTDYSHPTNGILPIKKGSTVELSDFRGVNVYKVYMLYD